MEEAIIHKLGKIIPEFIDIGRKMWIDYDKEADVLCISFEKPQNADESIMDSNVIVHKRGSRVVGVTITNASKFKR